MAIGLAFILILVVVVLVVTATRSRSPGEGEGDPDRGPSGLRRFFIYALLLTALIITAIGVSGLVEAALGERALAGGRRSGLARSLAFTVIAGPVYLLLWRHVWRLVRTPEERRSLGWGLYVGAALSVSLIVASTAVANSIEWLMGGDDRRELAVALVWAAVWVWHWNLIHRPSIGPTRVRLPALLFGSLWGLATTTISLGAILIELADRAYDQVTDTSLAGTSLLAGVRGPAGFLLVGVAAWIVYWWRHGRRLPPTPMWHTYVLVGGVAAGLVVTLGAVAAVFYTLLEWWWGDPAASTATEHFRVLPTEAIVGLIGLVVLLYHRSVHLETPRVGDTEPGRAGRYLVAGIGLLAAAGGLGSVVTALIETTVTPLARSGSAANTLLVGLILLLVGVPVWLSAWLPIQRVSAASDQELSAASRRIFLVALFGVGGVVALITLIVIAFQLFEHFLDRPTRGSLAEELALPVGLLVSTSAVAAYHWIVWREDRVRVPASTAQLKEVILVTGNSDALAEEIKQKTGARVRVLVPTDQLTVAFTGEDVLDALAGSRSPRVLIIPLEGEEVRLIAYHLPS